MKSKNTTDQEALFENMEESILDKQIDLNNFFKALAKEIVAKQYEYGTNKQINSRQLNGADNAFVLAKMKDLWEISPNKQFDWNIVKAFLERNNLLDKIYDFNNRINTTILSLRNDLFGDIYRIPYSRTRQYRDVYKPYPEEAFYNYVYNDGKKDMDRDNIYLGKVTKALEDYLLNIENALNNKTPASEITINKSQLPGRPPSENRSLTSSIRFLIDVTRLNSQGEAFREVFKDSSETRQKLGGKEVGAEPYERVILQQLGEHLVRANIEIVKEKVKMIPAKDLLPDPELEIAMNKYLADRAKPIEIPLAERVFEKASSWVGYVGSMWGGGSSNETKSTSGQKSETEDKKKISSSTNRMGKVREFIYNNAPVALGVIGGVSLAFIGCYTGGLTLLPILGLAYNTTYYTIAAESIIGSVCGFLSGSLASYLSAPAEGKIKPNNNRLNNSGIDHSNAHRQNEQNRRSVPRINSIAA